MDPLLVAYSVADVAALIGFSAVTIVGIWKPHAEPLQPFPKDQGYAKRIFVDQETGSANGVRLDFSSHARANIVAGGQPTPVSASTV